MLCFKYKTICPNYVHTKTFIPVTFFFKKMVFSFFSYSKIAAKYAEMGRVGKLKAEFNKLVLLIISEIFRTVSWNINT